MITLLGIGAVAALISAGVIALRLRRADCGVDVPGDRSLHGVPTPHGGGAGIVLATVLGGLWGGVAAVWLVPFVALSLLSVVDDWRHLPFWFRLPLHLAAAGSVVFWTVDGDVASAILLTLAIGWTTNAYNFMDGADGLSGTMTAIGFAAYAIGFSAAGFGGVAVMCVATAGAAVGFLRFNWHPARIFMGDVGSIPLGFLAGGLGWYGATAGAWPVWFGPMVFAPFLLDATLTLVRRAWRRERVWEAHREHCYQRMVRAGMSHGQMCRRWAAVMLTGACAALAVLAIAPSWGWIVLLAWSGVLVALGVRATARWRNGIMAR